MSETYDFNGKTIPDVIRDYRKLRDEIDRKRKDFKKEEADAKNTMDAMSMWLKDKVDALGVTSLPTSEGTAYRSTKSYARISDWSKFSEHVLKTRSMFLLEKRVSKLAFIEYMEALNEELDGQFAPEDIGVTYSEEIEILVRSN